MNRTTRRAARVRRLAIATLASRAFELDSYTGVAFRPRHHYGPNLPLHLRTDTNFVVDRIIRPARRIAERLDFVGLFHSEAARAAREPKE